METTEDLFEGPGVVLPPYSRLFGGSEKLRPTLTTGLPLTFGRTKLLFLAKRSENLVHDSSIFGVILISDDEMSQVLCSF